MAKNRKLRQETLASLPAVLVVTLGTLAAHELGWLHTFEAGSRDFMHVLSRTETAADVKIIGIDDQDHQRVFGGHYPLAAIPLCRLVAAVGAGRPAVIGVDIDTSLWTRPEVDSCLATLSGQLSPTTQVIWASTSRINMYREDTDKLHVIPALGGAKPPTDRGTGVSVLPVDRDGLIRRHERYVPTDDGMLPSFATAVVDAYRHRKEPLPSGDITLNFSGKVYDLIPLKASMVFELAKGEGWSEAGPLTNKVALIGAYYQYARDVHATPVGLLPGIEITAQVVQTEISGRGTRYASEFKMVVLEILMGFGLVLINWKFPSGRGWAFAATSTLVIAPFASWFAFSTLALWLNFVPIFLALVLHRFVDLRRENLQLEEENAELRKKSNTSPISNPAT